MERESSLEERERKDREKAEAIQARRVRLGHVEAESKEETESKEESEFWVPHYSSGSEQEET
jgi:hypothetical protein